MHNKANKMTCAHYFSSLLAGWITLSQGAFHLSELAGQSLPDVMRISPLIKTIQPDQSNPKQCKGRRQFLGKNLWKKPISLSKSLVRPASSDKWKAPLVSSFLHPLATDDMALPSSLCCLSVSNFSLFSSVFSKLCTALPVCFSSVKHCCSYIYALFFYSCC